MKKSILIALALMAGVASPALAQNYRGGDDNRYDGRSDNRGDYRRDDDRRDNDRDNGRGDRFNRIPNNQLPREFLNGRYMFDGWKERGLKKPVRGQAWVHVCDAYILTSMRTGAIAEVHETGRGRVDNKGGWRLGSSLRCLR